MTTQTRPDTCPDCPSGDELTGLIQGNLPDARQSAVADHVGDCPGCQARMESLATGGDDRLSDVVRHIDKVEPPSNSAFWHALNRAEAELTAAFPVDTGASGELKLDFLQPSDTPGRLGRLGTFEILRVIGRGGMGVVLHAFDPYLSRDVAIKILDPQLANNDVARQRFCREARAAAAVTHDNLVAVHQVNEDEKSALPFLVMQLVNGESLEQRIKRAGRLTVADAVRVGAQAAAGLAAAHEQGLIHRDIKPGNILLEAGSDKVKLTDFGLARAAEDLKLTRTGFVAGTPLYMAPEQARGDEVDARADLFSLGSVLYEALAGHPPFNGKTPLAVLRRVADEAHTPLSRLNPEVPGWLEEVIDRLLAKEPDDRFQSAAEVSELLAHKLAHLGTPGAVTAGECLLVGSKTSLAAKKARRHICYRTVGLLAAVFGVGLVTGGAGTWAFAPRPKAPAAENGPAAAAGAAPVVAAKGGDGPSEKDLLPADSGGVWSVALTRDGSTLVAGHETGRVSVWDVPNRRLRFDLHPAKAEDKPAHAGSVWAVDVTPDGKRVISASDEGGIKVWDLTTGQEEKTIPVGRSIRSAALSPNGNWVAVGDRYGTVRVFDIFEESVKAEYDQGSTVNAVAFSPKGLGLSLASAGTDGTVVVWDMVEGATGRRRLTLTAAQGGHTGPVYGLGFSPDGDRLVTTGWDAKVIVWDLQAGKKVQTIPDAHAEGAWAAQFAPCGRLIATAGQDGKTKVWDAGTRELLATYGRHKGAVYAARFSRDGMVLATGGREGSIRTWAVECTPK